MPDTISHVDDGSPKPVTAGPISPGLLLLMMNQYETEPKPAPKEEPKENPLIALFLKVFSEQSRLLRRLADLYGKADG